MYKLEALRRNGVEYEIMSCGGSRRPSRIGRGRNNEHRACDANVLTGAFAGMSGVYCALPTELRQRKS
jgi:hypothetical protein